MPLSCTVNPAHRRLRVAARGRDGCGSRIPREPRRPAARPARWNFRALAIRFWNSCRICVGSASIVGQRIAHRPSPGLLSMRPSRSDTTSSTSCEIDRGERLGLGRDPREGQQVVDQPPHPAGRGHASGPGSPGPCSGRSRGTSSAAGRRTPGSCAAAPAGRARRRRRTVPARCCSAPVRPAAAAPLSAALRSWTSSVRAAFGRSSSAVRRGPSAPAFPCRFWSSMSVRVPTHSSVCRSRRAADRADRQQPAVLAVRVRGEAGTSFGVLVRLLGDRQIATSPGLARHRPGGATRDPVPRYRSADSSRESGPCTRTQRRLKYVASPCWSPLATPIAAPLQSACGTGSLKRSSPLRPVCGPSMSWRWRPYHFSASPCRSETGTAWVRTTRSTPVAAAACETRP